MIQAIVLFAVAVVFYFLGSRKGAAVSAAVKAEIAKIEAFAASDTRAFITRLKKVI